MRDPGILRRSVLFFPALSPERLPEAMASGADMVCFDLEDGTAPGRKEEARRACLPIFAGRAERPVRRLLRINSPRNEEGLRDLLCLAETATPPDGIILPKVGNAEEIRWVAGILGPRHPAMELVILIETPEGLRNAEAIAGAAPQVSCLFLGSADFSAEIGSDRGWDALLYARGRIVVAAASAGIDAMDGVWFDPTDEDGLKQEAQRVAAMGFTGKASYDARQIPHIHTAFTPSAEAVGHARRVLAAAAADTLGTTRLDGRMINESIARSARRVIALAERADHEADPRH